MKMKKREHNFSGFTLVELIIVIVLIGILSVVVAPRISIEGFDAEADITRFMINVKYTRHRAMVTGGDWGIILDTSNDRYTIIDDTGIAAQLPSGRDNPIVLSGDLSYTIAGGLINNTVFFNNLGQPTASVDNTDLLLNDITISIGVRNIIIAPNSGGIYE